MWRRNRLSAGNNYIIRITQPGEINIFFKNARPPIKLTISLPPGLDLFDHRSLTFCLKAASDVPNFRGKGISSGMFDAATQVGDELSDNNNLEFNKGNSTQVDTDSVWEVSL